MIEGGAAFAKSIEAALENSNAVIVVWSAASVGSDWVLDEAAKGRDLRKLVPVTFDGTEAPLGFRQYQAIDLSHWRGDPRAPAIVSIVRAIRVATGQAVRQSPASHSTQPPACVPSRHPDCSGRRDDRGGGRYFRMATRCVWRNTRLAQQRCGAALQERGWRPGPGLLFGRLVGRASRHAGPQSRNCRSSHRLRRQHSAKAMTMPSPSLPSSAWPICSRAACGGPARSCELRPT